MTMSKNTGNDTDPITCHYIPSTVLTEFQPSRIIVLKYSSNFPIFISMKTVWPKN